MKKFDGTIEHVMGQVWYSDGTANSEGRVGSDAKPTCGCATCDEIFHGRGMLRKLLKHANTKHKANATKIWLDDGMVNFILKQNNVDNTGFPRKKIIKWNCVYCGEKFDSKSRGRDDCPEDFCSWECANENAYRVNHSCIG